MGGHGDGVGPHGLRRARADRGLDSAAPYREPGGHRGADPVPLLAARAAHHGRDPQRERRERALRMIVLLFTGGTISMRHDAALGGAVPALSGEEIVAATRGLADVAPLELEQWGRFPGPHMTVDRMWALRTRIAEHLARPEV